MDSYFSIQKEAIGEYKEKGSKFLAYVYPVGNEEDVVNALSLLKSEHPKARHFCYAYRLGLTGDQYRMNDDGEPSGTAGKPIFGQLLSFEISDVLAVVVRYFGGTKLGASGLIHAYKTATHEALMQSEKIEIVLKKSFQLSFPVAELGHVFFVLKELNIDYTDPEYGEEVTLIIQLRLSEEEKMLLQLKSLMLKCPVEQVMVTEEWFPFQLAAL